MIIDRLENKRYEKNIKFFKWVAIGSFIAAIARILSEPNILTGAGKTFDYVITLYPIGLYFQYRKTAKNWNGQFFEWKQNELKFKSRKYDKTIIAYTSIKSIEIKLDFIYIETTENSFEINIEDYTEYEDRMRLKENFKKLKNKLHSINTINSSQSI